MGMGPLEILLILLLAFLFFGPDKLPEMAAKAGRLYRNFRRATFDLSKTITEEMETEKKTLREDLSNISKTITQDLASDKKTLSEDLSTISTVITEDLVTERPAEKDTTAATEPQSETRSDADTIQETIPGSESDECANAEVNGENIQNILPVYQSDEKLDE
jgi:sec-independent protein translocase protein TatB